MKLVEIHTDVGECFKPPSPLGAIADYQLKGGARNDEEPVKHAPQTPRSRRAAVGGAAAAAGPRCSPPRYTSAAPFLSGRLSADGFCGEVGAGEPPGEERPHRLHRQQHAVCVRRLPGGCASPAQVCAANATAPIRCLSSVLIQVSVTAKRPEEPKSPTFCFSARF